MVRKRRRGLQQLQHLLRAEDHRKAMIFLGGGDQGHAPVPPQGNAIKEPQGTNGYRPGANGSVSLLSQIELISTDLFWA